MHSRQPARESHGLGQVGGDSAIGSGSVEQLLAELFRRGVRVSAADGRLRCTGPTELLNGRIGATVRQRKPEILAFLAGLDAAPDRPIPALGATEPPLSTVQTGLWVAEQMHPGVAHHIPFAVEARGTLDMTAVEHALSRIMARHSVLRLRIALQDNTPHQRIDADTTPPVSRLDALHISQPEVDSLIAAEAARPFDLAAGPPLRLCVVRRAADTHLLLFTLHHIAADASSAEILIAEFGAYYREAVTGVPAALAPLPIQYGDYAAWQLSPEAQARQDAQMRFWRDRLGTDLPVTRLPTDFLRPAVQTQAGAFHRIAIPPGLSERLRALGAAQNASLVSVLLTAFDILVYRYTGQRDLVVGIPSTNRSRAEAEPLVGLFVNPLPIRSRIDPAAGFEANLALVRTDLLEALDHQEVPFERLAESFQTVRDPGASPLFQLKFQLDRAPRDRLDLPDLAIRLLPRRGAAARHDLSLDLVERLDGVSGHIEYCTALFRAETVAALAGHYLTLLDSIAAAPDRPVALLAMLSDEERHRHLVAWNDTVRAIDAAERFPALFERHAAATPDAIAVEYVADGEATTESYAALNRRANRLAHELRRRGAGPDTIIGIALERGADMVAAWLAVLKSGAAYLPLDPTYPAERLAFMLEDSGASLVLTHSRLDLPIAGERLDLDRPWPAGPEDNPAPAADSEDLAYLIYTSGSTGRPKGVEVPHAGLVNLARDKIRTCDVRPGDRVLGFFSFSFDASIPDLVMSLGAGARLVLSPAEDVLPGPGLARLLRDRRATHLTITPSALASTPADDLPDLRMVLAGGEAPAPELIERWSEGRLFINAYGPTETTVNASMVACGNGHPVEPTLRAPANKQLYVLDENLELLPVGCPGELCIGGLGLARGYRGRPGQTAAVFVPDPFAGRSGGPARRLYRTGDRAVRLADGRIRLLGRVDEQVKIRGYRIEPGEVARACQSHPGVAAAVIAPRELADKGTRLVAYLVAEGARPDDSEIREHLIRTLPSQMVPDAIVWLDRLPLTVNGKLDMGVLPEPQMRSGRGRAPEGPVETAIAAIFAELLDIERPGADDDFFDLGGNSLLATRLAAAIEDRFGEKLRMLELFEASSIVALARRIRRVDAVPLSDEGWRADLPLDETIRPTGPVPVPPTLPVRVLLTGATGFVGAHLLHELLRDGNRTVLCLSRHDGADAIERALAHYGLWHPDLAARIEPIHGDLAAPGLGLPARERDRLRAESGAILHCGAEVHHVSPYRALRAANVEGTREILRLAAQAACPLHHISTLSALVPGAGPVEEGDTAAAMEPPAGGYNLSKWVAERLVAEAGARGLPVTIYRLGSVSGSSRTGAFNAADILGRLLSGFLASGAAPEGRVLVNLLPVDYVAQAIRHLAGRPESAGRVYHLTHSAPVSSDLLFDACAAEGRPLRRLPAAEWQELLHRIAREEPGHPLYPLAALGGGQGHVGEHWPYSCAATRAALDDVLPEPPLTGALLRRYVRDFFAAAEVRS